MPRLIIKYFSVIIFVAITISATSCNHVADVSELESYDISSGTRGTIEDIFSGVEAIELKFDGKNYPSSIYRLNVDTNMIMICDNKNRLYILDDNGNMISSSADKRGEGPGEYPSLMGFSWNPYSNTVQIITPKKLMFYDRDFNFIKETPLPIKPGNPKTRGLYFRDIFDISGNMHVLSPSGISPEPYRYFIFDSERGIVTDEIRYDDDAIGGANMQSVSFFRQPDGKILCRPMALTQYVYEFEPNPANLKRLIKLEPGDDGITRKQVADHNSSERELADYLLNTNRKVPLRVMVTSKRVVVNIKSGNSLRSMSSTIYDRTDKRAISVNYFDNDTRSFPMIECINQDTAYAVMEKSDLLSNPALLLNDEAQKEKVEKFDEENFILLKYRFR